MRRHKKYQTPDLRMGKTCQGKGVRNIYGIYFLGAGDLNWRHYDQPRSQVANIGS